MFKLKHILKACVCSFCKNIYEYDCIDENEFLEFLKEFLSKDDLQAFLKSYSADANYDYIDIDNIVNNLKSKNKKYNVEETMNFCKLAFLRTIQTDKTIEIQALVDNVTKEFTKT